jgi:3',5'-cyclic AMP phosphodiesterase CpdA
MKIVHISDTHDKLDQLLHKIPNGDILCHTGDFSNQGGKDSLLEFNQLLGQLPHKHKIVVFGNHDYYQNIKPEEIQKYLTNAIYLQDSSVTVEGIKFYGSPWTNMMSYCSNNLKNVWSFIPNDTGKSF